MTGGAGDFDDEGSVAERKMRFLYALRSRGVTDHRVLSAMERTDRGLFRIAAEHTSAVVGYTPITETAEITAEAFNEQAIWTALKTCFDPEIPVNIVDLGLVYDLAIDVLPDGTHSVEAKMTLTAQGCGMGPVIAEDARQKIAALPTVSAAKVHIVWDPIWTPQMISPEGRKTLGLE